MRKRNPPPGRDRLPAMFVGDEESAAMPPAVPAEALVAGAHEAAAMLPDDLCVVIEGTTRHRVPFVGAAILGVAVFALGIFKNTVLMPDEAQYRAFYTALLGASVLIGGLGYRLFARHRKEFRVTDDGIVLEVWHATDRKPWVTRIPWTEIQDYTVSIGRDAAFLRVESVRGYTLTLDDRPPRLSTRELIRRFIDQAERYPRAVRPQSGAVDESANVSVVGCVGYAVLFIAGVIVEKRFAFLLGPLASIAILSVAALGLGLWYSLDDPDVAHGDRTSRKLMARLRRWLRKVLGIDVI
jgi:hypothetical protein